MDYGHRVVRKNCRQPHIEFLMFLNKFSKKIDARGKITFLHYFKEDRLGHNP